MDAAGSTPVGGSESGWTRVRQVVNWVNLSTPLGFLIALAGRATVQPHARGTWLATGYRLRFPVANAFAVGNVIVTGRDPEWCAARPAVMRHEDRHCTQYAFCLGPIMLPLYGICAAVSWALSGSHASYNPFERLANLIDGGYADPVARFRRKASGQPD